MSRQQSPVRSSQVNLKSHAVFLYSIVGLCKSLDLKAPIWVTHLVTLVRMMSFKYLARRCSSGRL